MNQTQALRHIMKHNAVVRRTVDKLVLYSPKMTATDYARTCGVQLGTSYQMSAKYKLKLVKRYDYSIKKAATEQKKQELIAKWDPQKTCAQNALVLGISHTRALCLCREYNLTHGRNYHSTTLRKIEQIKEWKAKGLNDAQVARVIGVTRERVRQLLFDISIKKEVKC